MQNPLSKELKIACEIYKNNLNNETVWTDKLINRFKDDMTKTQVIECINTLFDWSLLRAEYGLTENGKEGRLYRISHESLPLVKEMYEKWWI